MIIHDKCKQVIVFHNHLVQFFQNLKEVFPDMKKDIKTSIKLYRDTERKQYIVDLHERLKPHISYITEYDEGLFSDDYSHGALELLPHVDFKHLWTIIDSEDFVLENETVVNS